MENLHGNMHVFCAFMFKIFMKAQKHARLFSHLVPPFPPLHYNVKGL